MSSKYLINRYGYDIAYIISKEVAREYTDNKAKTSNTQYLEICKHKKFEWEIIKDEIIHNIKCIHFDLLNEIGQLSVRIIKGEPELQAMKNEKLNKAIELQLKYNLLTR